jgi:hypothetical protein
MTKSLANTICAVIVWSSPVLGWADATSQQEMRSLDEQVQEIKTDVLSIATDLNQLEERLLFPSNTQVSVFISLSPQDPFRLDAVQIRIDGELATHHIYSFKELDALKSGGIQRVFTGNYSTGEHQLEVSVIGKLENGKDYKESRQFTFNKSVDPRLLGVALADPGSSSGPIELQTW